MANKYQTWVSTASDMRPVLEMIYETFPDVEPGNDAQAYRTALLNWYHGRQKNSKSAKLGELKKDTESIKEDTRIIPSIQQELAELRALVMPKLERLMTLEAAINSGCDCAEGFDEEGYELQ